MLILQQQQLIERNQDKEGKSYPPQSHACFPHSFSPLPDSPLV